VSEPGAEQEQQLQLSVSLSSIRSDPKEPGNLQHRLKTSVTGKISGNAIWEATVVYLGDFSLESPAEVTLEQVQSIHAPAMLYSYAREHIADLIRRANLGALVLPPMNFAKVSGQTG
jgi:preprotein translocase subunit SecB